MPNRKSGLVIVNNEIFIANLKYLAKNNNKKIGDIESAVGYSTGYFSRISSSSTKKISADALLYVSNMFNVDAYAIATTDITCSEYNIADINLITKLIDKLFRETTDRNIEWCKELSLPERQGCPYIEGVSVECYFNEEGTTKFYVCLDENGDYNLLIKNNNMIQSVFSNDNIPKMLQPKLKMLYKLADHMINDIKLSSNAIKLINQFLHNDA